MTAVANNSDYERRLLAQLPDKVLTFLRTVATKVEIRASLFAAGYSTEEQAAGWSLLEKATGYVPDVARMSDDDWRTVIDTNLASCFYTCRAVTRPMMKRRAGAIVNVSSIVGVHGNWGQTNYAASKAGIIGFTKSLAKELGSRNVRANVVAPGYVTTRLTEVLPEEPTKTMLDATALGRLGEPVRCRHRRAILDLVASLQVLDGGAQ